VLIFQLRPDYTFELVNLQKTDSLNVIWAETYFEINKATLQQLRNAGFPETMAADLKPLKYRAFLDEKAFIEALEKQIGKKHLQQYQELLLNNAWNWTQAYFTFTEQDVQRLREAGAPDPLLKQLATLTGMAFVQDDHFLQLVEEYIGRESREKYRAILLDHIWTQVRSITEVRSNIELIKQKMVSNAFTDYLSSLPDLNSPTFE
jgi:hypothetical protein